jgi:acyl-CoA thioester hydrolase
MTITIIQTERPFVETSFRVRYAETDQMGVAHHSAYFVWFEYARTEFCRKHGIDYKAMEASGLFMPVVDVRCRYKSAARYDDEVTIRAEVVERTRRTMRIHYLVKCSHTLLAEGETLQMLVDSERRPRSFPADVAARFDGKPDLL